MICDEGLDPVDETNRELILSLMKTELAESAVINVSQRREPTDFYKTRSEARELALDRLATQSTPAAGGRSSLILEPLTSPGHSLRRAKGTALTALPGRARNPRC